MSDDRYVKILLTSVAGFLMVVTGAAALFFTAEAVLGVVRGMARLLVLIVPVVLVVAAVVGAAISISRKRIWERDEAARARKIAVSPTADHVLAIAREYAPETLTDVEATLASIEALRRLPPLDMPIVVEALSLAEHRLPGLLDRHTTAMTGANANERREIAMHTLSGVGIIGRSCEEARAAAVAALGDDVETEARYLAARTSDNDLTR